MVHMRVLPLLLVLLAACGVLLSGCGAPLAGQWQGTFDRGPVAAHALTVHVQEDGQKGWLEVREPGKAFARFTLCSLDVDPNRQVTLTYDANRPNCDTGTQNPDKPELRTLKGHVGEAVFYGDVLRGAESLGFFRVFREAEHLPGDVTGS